MIWTSKWRIPTVRLPASRTTAKTSGSIASSDSPCSSRFLNSAVFACSSASGSAENCSSKALTARAGRRRRATSRSLPSTKLLRNAMGVGMLLRNDSYSGYGAGRSVSPLRRNVVTTPGSGPRWEDVDDARAAGSRIGHVSQAVVVDLDVGRRVEQRMAALDLANRLRVGNLLVIRREDEDRRGAGRVAVGLRVPLVDDIDVAARIEGDAGRRNHFVLRRNRKARVDVDGRRRR